MNIYKHLDMTAKMGIAESLNEKLNRYEVGEAKTVCNCNRRIAYTEIII